MSARPWSHTVAICLFSVCCVGAVAFAAAAATLPLAASGPAPSAVHAIGNDDIQVGIALVSPACSGTTVPTQAPQQASVPFNYISNLQLSQGRILGDPALPMTVNLASQVPMPPTLIDDIVPTGGTVQSSSNATYLAVTGIVYCNASRLVATDTWTLAVDGTSLSMRVDRTYGMAGAAASDRFPSLLLQTTTGAYYDDRPEDSHAAPTPPADWRKRVQMPSWVATDRLLHPRTGLAYPVGGGDGTPQTQFAALLSDDAGPTWRRVLLSPSGIEVNVSTIAPHCRYAVIRPGKWVVQQVGHGAECAASATGQRVPYAAGQQVTNTLSLQFSAAAQGHAPFHLSGVDPAVSSFATTFGKTMNMFMGFMYGNSPASESCLHESSVFTQFQGMFGPGGVGGAASVLDANAMQFDFLLSDAATQGVNASGWLDPRWSIVGLSWPDDKGGGYVPPTDSMGIIDQQPHTVLAVYYHAVNTGDAAAVKRWMPALDRLMSYMLTVMRLDPSTPGGGVLTNTMPACDGVSNHSCADNWLDDIRMGWHDGIVGAYAVRAVGAMAELKAFVGDTAGAAKYSAMLPRVREAYNAVFWSDADGYYTDWVDVEGGRHSYWYVWTQASAIIFDIANATQAISILASREALYAGLRARFNATADDMFCAPTNLIPTDPKDITVDFDDEFVYPHYENGQCFFWHSGLETLALGKAAGAQAAYDRFAGAAPHFAATRFWGQRYGWLEHSPLGDDVITDALHFMYGFLRGAFNVERTLNDGIKVSGAPAASLEGAAWSFVHLGRNATVTITHGKQVITYGA